MVAILVYITTADKAQAEEIATALIERRLAACANILDGITSLYRWEGKLERSEECLLLAKTQSARLDEVVATVRSMHPYELPCITALPVTGGNEEFLQWIEAETAA